MPKCSLSFKYILHPIQKPWKLFSCFARGRIIDQIYIFNILSTNTYCIQPPKVKVIEPCIRSNVDIYPTFKALIMPTDSGDIIFSEGTTPLKEQPRNSTTQSTFKDAILPQLQFTPNWITWATLRKHTTADMWQQNNKTSPSPVSIILDAPLPCPSESVGRREGMILPGPRVTVVLCKPIRPNSLQDMAGIEWAPLKLPIKRRLQTLAVMIHVYTFLFGHIFGVLLLLVLLLFPYTTIFALLYLGWAYVLNAQTPSRGGRIIPRLRRWKLWKYFCDFFPIHLVKTAELDPKKNYIIGYHPHGIMGFGALGNFNSEATGFSEKFPGIVPHLLTLAGNFRLPFMRDYIMAFGNCSVEKGSIEHIVQKMGPGHSAIIVLGGAAESLDAHPGSFKLTIKNRKGFVKIALRTG